MPGTVNDQAKEPTAVRKECINLSTIALPKLKKKNNSFYILLFGIIAGLAAAFGVAQIINLATNAVPVVVAAQDIQPFTRITAADVKIDMMPRSAVRHGMFPNVNAVIGKVSNTEIPQGWPVSAQALEPNTPGGILTAQITAEKNPELRAVPLKLDDITSLGGQISPGDRVDVVGAMKLPVNGGNTQPVCRIIARNVKVLNIIKGGNNSIAGVILAMTPQQDQELQFAQSSGTISLALNPVDADVTAANTSPTTAYSFVTKMLSGNVPGNNNQNQGGGQ